MAKLHLEGGVTFEGTPEEIKAYTDLYAEGGAEKAQEKPEPAQSFKEGDIVVITESNYDRGDKSNVGWAKSGQGLMKSGAIGEVISVNDNLTTVKFDDSQPVDSADKRDLQAFVLHIKEMRHATQAEREQYEEALKPKLKAGDWVKFTEDGTDITAGKVYEIKANADGDLYFLDDEGDDRTYPISGDSDYQFEIVKATKPPSVFERIGRKEGEFKIGDIVRVITGEFTLFEPGTIGELVSGAHFICPRKFGVKHGDTTQDCYDDFELIAPVESRVDRP